MAKEITVTFEDGAVFNGYASSYTKDEQTTYYFDIDKRYRIQVDSTNQILMQQYQNTNGSWYNIDIIVSAVVSEIQAGSGNVTIEYLNENYYTKQDTDSRYVKKTGDTMSGKLTIAYDGYSVIIGNNVIDIYQDTTRLMELYQRNINLYQGALYMRTGDAGSPAANIISNNGMYLYLTDTTYATILTKDGLYLYDNNNTFLAYLVQEQNRSRAAFHVFNESRILLHTGAPGTTEQYIELKGTNVNQGNGAAWTISPKVYHNADLVVQNAWIYVEESQSPSSDQSNLQIRNDAIMIMQNRNSLNAYYSYLDFNGLTVQPNNSGATSKYQYNHMSHEPSGIAFAVDDTNLHIYKGGRVVLHSGEASTTEQFVQFNNNGMIVYNANNSFTYSFNLNSARFEISNAYTLLINTLNLIHATAGTSLTLTDNGGSIVVGNIIQALNNAFYGENFLNALNQVLVYILQKLNTTYYVEFTQQNYGGGFVAGGGSSRGGGVGRRS